MYVKIFKPTVETRINDIFKCEVPLEDSNREFFKKAARNVIDSMQDRYCDCLIEEIRNYCNELLQERDEKNEEIRKKLNL